MNFLASDFKSVQRQWKFQLLRFGPVFFRVLLTVRESRHPLLLRVARIRTIVGLRAMFGLIGLRFTAQRE